MKTYNDVKVGDTIGVVLPNNCAKLVKVTSITKDKEHSSMRHIHLDDDTEFSAIICDDWESVIDMDKGVYSYFADLGDFDRFLSKDMNELKKAMSTIKAVRKDISTMLNSKQE